MNRTVKQSLYQLKRHFSVKATLYQRSVVAITDDFSGVQTVNTVTKPIRAILLPVEYTVQERLDRGASSRYSGDLKVGDREFIVDQKYGVSVGDYLVYQAKRWDVIEIADYEGLAYHVLVRNIQDEPAP